MPPAALELIPRSPPRRFVPPHRIRQAVTGLCRQKIAPSPVPYSRLPSLRPSLVTLFLKSLGRYLSLLLQLLTSPRHDGRRLTGFLLVLGAIPLLVAVQLLHWLTFLLDEIFYRGYRDVPVRQPLFVLGPPRTGTTHLHRVLSEDARAAPG